MAKHTIISLTIKVDIWAGIDEEVNVQKEVEETMSQLNHRTLEEFGGCLLLDYNTQVIDDEVYDCRATPQHITDVNGV